MTGSVSFSSVTFEVTKFSNQRPSSVLCESRREAPVGRAGGDSCGEQITNLPWAKWTRASEAFSGKQVWASYRLGDHTEGDKQRA